MAAHRQRIAVAFFAALLALALGFAGGLTGILGFEKGDAGNPEEGLTDEERAALHARSWELNELYLKEFVAKGGDPRSLPVVELQAYTPPPVSLAEGVRSATTILRGKVGRVDFASNPDGGLPLATSTIEVDRVFLGDAAGTVEVLQLGGPMGQDEKGSLAQLDADPVLLAGDDVLLLLFADTKGRLRPVFWIGVNRVAEDGTIRPQEGNPFASEVAGKPVSDFVSALRSMK